MPAASRRRRSPRVRWRSTSASSTSSWPTRSRVEQAGAEEPAMAVEIKVPTLGESVTEATVAKWLKAAGDAVAANEPLVELETDKVALEVNAPTAGRLAEVLVPEGTDVAV